MEKRVEILKELNEISPLVAGINPENVFKVPVGYFEQLSEAIWREINPPVYFFQQAGNSTPFSLPNGYFENLPNSILQKINEREVSFLAGASKNMPQQIENGYFENLPDTILSKIKAMEPQPAKVIPISSVKKASRWVRFAAAAVFIGVITIFFLNYFKGGSKLDNTTKDGLQIAQKGSFDKELNNLSNESIFNYLTNTSEVQSDDELFADNMNEDDLPSELEWMANDKLMDDLLNEPIQKTSNN